MPLTSGFLISHYEIRSKIGAGGMGEVYLALDTRLGRNVALKLLPEDLAHDPYRMQRFIQEAQAASAINHPNVCIIHEVGESDDGRSFIAMEYVEGETLAKKIQQHPLSSEEIVTIGIQVADALSEAHSKGIIHRDIKPSNIAISSRGQVKVLDFGLARIVPPEGLAAIGELPTQAKTESGILLGTVDYMSPEQALGRHVDARSDIFSLGVVFFEMATGRKPFSSQNPLETIDRIAHAEPEPISRINKAISTELEHIITKCLAKNPRHRFQTALDLKTRLESLEQGAPVFYRRSVLLIAVLSILLGVLWAPSVRQSILEWFGWVPLPPQKYLVVLPLRVVGDDLATRNFAEGLMETITAKLSLLEQFHHTLFVVPAAEVRDRDVTSISKAGTTFGVTLVVSGSVQRDGDRVRLTLNLNDATTLRQIWSFIDDYVLGNVLTLQDGVAVKLAKALELQLLPEMERVLARGSTAVPGAFDLYTQARGYLLRFEDVKSVDAALGLFQQALQLDPNYAAAFAGTGEAFWRKFEATHDTQWVAKAVESCLRAQELERRLPEVAITLGLISSGTGKSREAIEHFEQALHLDPANSEAYRGMARAYEALGTKENLDKAEQTYLKAIELKPGYWAGYSNLGRFYYYRGRLEDAIRQFKHVTTLTPDNYRGHASLGALYYHTEKFEEARNEYERSLEIQPNLAAYQNLGTLYFYQGQYEEAARTYDKALNLSNTNYHLWANLGAAQFWTPGKLDKALENYARAAQMAEQHYAINPANVRVVADLAGYYGILGKRQQSLALIEKMLRMSPEDVHVLFEAAHTYEQLGMRDQALEWLKKAIQKGYSLKEIEWSPFLGRLRTDARYQELVRLK